MNNNIDMGEMTSRDIGNLMSKTLIERGKEIASTKYPNTEFKDLPSNTLVNLGKQAFAKNNNNDN